MKKNYAMTAASIITAGTFLGACSSPMPQQPVYSQPAPVTAPSPSYSSAYGVVESIQMVGASGSSGSGGGVGTGAVLGGVAGGVLGNQVGDGRGQTAATVAGAVGGAVVGHQIEQRRRAQQAQSSTYQIGVRLDDGSYQTITQDTVADLNIGNRVRIENGRAYRY